MYRLTSDGNNNRRLSEINVLAADEAVELLKAMRMDFTGGNKYAQFSIYNVIQ